MGVHLTVDIERSILVTTEATGFIRVQYQTWISYQTWMAQPEMQIIFFISLQVLKLIYGFLKDSRDSLSTYLQK